VIANGTEIRIYSPLREVAFERSLLYSIKRQDLGNESTWMILSILLHNKNLQSRSVLKRIDEREKEIKDKLANEERLIQYYDNKINDVDSYIETKEEEIQQLKTERGNLIKEKAAKESEIWNAIGLPLVFPTSIIHSRITTDNFSHGKRAGNVTLQELVDAGLVEDGQTLFLFYNQQIRDEQVQIVASSNKLKYKKDGKEYRSSVLALKPLKEHRIICPDKTSIQGPLHWQTEDGKMLNDLNEQVRSKRGDRR
jgi:hypothetical protein